MKVYGSLASPYVARVTIFAAIKGVELTLEDPPGGSVKSPEYLALSPIARMPVLDVNGKGLAESEIICEYLQDLYPDRPGLPADPFQRAQVRLLARIVDLYLAPNTGGLFGNMNPADRDQPAVDEAAAGYGTACSYLEHYMGPGPLALADEPTLADASIAPYLGLMSRAILPAFPDIPDPLKSDGRLGEWWHAISNDPVCGPRIEEYSVAVEAFIKMLRARQSG